MPIYRVQGPDGTVYRVEGPAGASDQQLIAAVQQQVQPQQAQPTPTTPEQPTPAPEEDFGFLDTAQFYTTDMPVRVLRGAITGVRGLTNLAGADNPVSE